jgi:hypothetical protein
MPHEIMGGPTRDNAFNISHSRRNGIEGADKIEPGLIFTFEEFLSHRRLLHLPRSFRQPYRPPGAISATAAQS